MAKVETITAKPVKLTNPDTGVEYTLEFNREAIEAAEEGGLTVSDLASKKYLTVFGKLFYYSFHMHHPEVTHEEANKILYEGLGGVDTDILSRLIQLYTETYNTLVRTPEKSKNSPWRVKM